MQWRGVWLLTLYLLLVSSHNFESCSGPDKNTIVAVLKDVPWKDLADQLDLGQNTAIETTCRNDPASCYLKEVVKRFMSTQHAEPCRRTVEKIVTALEGLSPPHVKVASELRKKFNLDTESKSHGGDDSISDPMKESPSVHIAAEGKSSARGESTSVPAQEPASNGRENIVPFIITIIVIVITLCCSFFLFKCWTRTNPKGTLQTDSGLDCIEQHFQEKNLSVVSWLVKHVTVLQPRITWNYGQDNTVNGFALIVTNDYKGLTKFNKLQGPRIDGENMHNTMKMLKFETHWEHNASFAVTCALLRRTRNCQYRPNYKRLVFVFSGHGGANRILYTQDGKPIKIEEDILETFYPENLPRLGAMAKIFFIDACRGGRATEMIICRGGRDDKPVQVPQKSNILVAYATLEGHKSYEQGSGIWMTILADTLKTMNDTIVNVLIEVNRELAKRGITPAQQPKIDNCTLNEHVNFLKEAQGGQADEAGNVQPSATTAAAATPILTSSEKLGGEIKEDYGGNVNVNKKEGATGTTAGKGTHGKRPPIMKELIEHVTVAAHWHDFGIFLIDNKKVHKVHDIQNDPAFPTAQDKLKRVFQIFLADNPTWEAVVTALEGIVQNRLAKGIRKRFC